MGGILAEFFSFEEENAVDTILSQSSYYWIGLADSGQDNSWIWHENNKAPNYTNWYTGEPGEPEDDNCVLKASTGDFKWFASRCTYIIAGSYNIHALCKLFI